MSFFFSFLSSSFLFSLRPPRPKNKKKKQEEEKKTTHREVVPQRQRLPSLVRQVVDQLRVLAVLARERLPELEHGRVDRDRAVRLEDPLDQLQSLFPDPHLVWQEVACPFRDLGPAARGIGLCRGAEEGQGGRESGGGRGEEV